jgi:nitroimidazol reductase NimA-like FMN-containing flavoprotein (pyridoxamine 5'-phosphate oxidase superfamily)
VGIQTLSKQECLDLLARVPIGRVALTLNALPVIFPVNYTLTGDSVIYGAMAGSTLSRATDGAVAAFQADSYEPENRSGWTVMAIGQALHITDAETLGRLEIEGKLPEPWAIGQSGERYFQIDLSGVSGHRIV